MPPLTAKRQYPFPDAGTEPWDAAFGDFVAAVARDVADLRAERTRRAGGTLVLSATLWISQSYQVLADATTGAIAVGSFSVASGMNPPQCVELWGIVEPQQANLLTTISAQIDPGSLTVPVSGSAAFWPNLAFVNFAFHTLAVASLVPGMAYRAMLVGQGVQSYPAALRCAVRAA
jgi:hypothetical protein